MRRTGGTVALSMIIALVSCGEPTPPPAGDGSGTAGSGATDVAPSTGTVPATDTGVQTSAASSGGADSSGSGEESTGEPPTEGEPGVVRFAAFGDTGEGNEAQQMVANAAEVVCADRGCDFALLLGDNFYDEGVTSAMDQQFIDKFEVVYEGLDMPFYVVLGNHDYGTLANDWDRGNYQVEYSNYSDKWVLPHFWYTFSSDSGATQFFAFDTARMMWNHDVDDQRSWLGQEITASTAYWKVAIAHHPFISNGEHGNAGNYEGIPGLPIVSGVEIRDFVEDIVCGQAQVYISGHDHNRQMFDPVCGTYFFVSGASAKTSPFVHRDSNPTEWEDDTREGFLWVQIQGTELTAAFYDLDGNLDHEIVANL
ncbi:MAG: metallophosphoesterase [Myxococcales bacterium]|nr:metallophosphoesterase [Myxococcales bacterium]